MLISKLSLKNWRNFRKAEMTLRERVFVIGPNAAGKSNLLDVLRFLRDIARPEGGSLQLAVKKRGGMTKLRCLLARRDPEVSITAELAERVDGPAIWRYTLGFRSEGKGQQRVVVSHEVVENLKERKRVLDRPGIQDQQDPDRLTETNLENVNANKEFREVAQFFATLTYLHLVPQLLKYRELDGSVRLDGDPFGQSFLERIASTPERARVTRLKKIEAALRACVPNMRNLDFARDKTTGQPHLEALYEHWRPKAGRQSEEQFSDGTLRLLGIMWSLLEGDSLLLLEEPELSLDEDIVREIPRLLWDMQRRAKHRRQVFVSTHSQAMLQHDSIDAREVIRLVPGRDGAVVEGASETEQALVEAGHTVADAMLSKKLRLDLGALDSLSKP